ncbi:MAG: mechanosensitive ion channel family protein [Nitrosomonadales bacterium]|nr:mechanosensitive ion channel family protein [Nitrosomonadales bacterium]
MQEIFDHAVFGNTILDYLASFGIFVVGMAVVHAFKRYVLARLKKWADSTHTAIDDLLVGAVEKSLLPIFYFGVFYFSLQTLTLSERFAHGVKIAAIVLFTFLFVRMVTAAANHGLRSYLSDSGDATGSEKQLRGIRGLISFLIWAIALVFLLDNLGVKISAVVAGLGIGGIAVALAAQAVLGDLFSYFVIFFDKPFQVGDFIVIGDKMGVVEHVGIKTTRIRALSGEQLVFSNTDLTNSRIHNFKKMERRRVVFNLGVIYQTSVEKLKAIPGIVKRAIEAQDDTTYDRGHFSSYGDFSLNFEFVYYVTGADYNKYMDIQQAINLSIFDAFEKEKIEFAYPSQTLFVNKAG